MQPFVKTDRCELSDGTVYSLTSHWVPEIPSIGTKPLEGRFRLHLKRVMRMYRLLETISGTQTEKIPEIPKYARR